MLLMLLYVILGFPRLLCFSGFNMTDLFVGYVSHRHVFDADYIHLNAFLVLAGLPGLLELVHTTSIFAVPPLKLGVAIRRLFNVGMVAFVLLEGLALNQLGTYRREEVLDLADIATLELEAH